MIRNYLKIAWRHLLTNRAYSAINILGLSIGLAVSLLIALWVYKEYSYDKFLPEYQLVYQVKRNFNNNGQILTFNSTSLKLADALRSQIPEIAYLAETDGFGAHGLMAGDRKLYVNGAQTGSDFLKIFQYALLEGNADLALKEPYSIVLTRSVARALFNSEQVLGRTVRVDNRHDVKVTGILEDLPANSTLQFKFLLPFSYFEQTEHWVKEARSGSFGYNAFQQFVKLKPGASYEKVAAKIKDIEKVEDNINARNSDVILQPLAEWHLYSRYENGKVAGGFIEYVRIFGIIGMLVLLIACINFINLSTARSEKRAREVGIRKAIGSQRRQLIQQFLIESVLITFLAFICSLLFVQLSLPVFNALTNSNISIPFNSPGFWLTVIPAVLFTGLAAGGRPAFYLSAFNPLKTLKGGYTGRPAALSRKVLVVLQFSCSVALIISTIVVYRQMHYAMDRPVGYNMHRLMMTDMSSDLGRNYTALKHELLQSGLVEQVSIASSPATDINWHSNIDNWQGKHANETVEMGIVMVSADYFKTMGMQLESGRDFTGNTGADTFNVILNEAAVKRLRLKAPLNQVLEWNGRKVTVIGTVKNALMLSPFAPADPTMFVCSPVMESYMLYRLSPHTRTHEAVAKLKSIFERHNPAYPYQYRFVDETYNQKFNQEALMGKLSSIFAVLAVLISSLGLLGLAAFIAEQRTKEVGVRKVLGASVAQIWLLLTRDFILLVAIGCAIASPIALYFLQGWLRQYTYRIVIGPDVFIIAAVIAVAVTLLTVSFQAIKAAMANPVNSLRSE